jgi:hypothetical protein
VIGANGKTSKDEIEKVVANFKDEEITCRILATLRCDGKFACMRDTALSMLKVLSIDGCPRYQRRTVQGVGCSQIGQREELRQRAASSDSPRDRDN